MGYQIHFSGRAHAYTEAEIETVVTAMREAEPLTQGRFLQAFEARFREYAGVPHAFAVCNATAALEMAAQLCRFHPGDEVIIPSHTFTATAYPFVKKGAKVVWADIDPETRVVTSETIGRCLSPRTRAIVVVHLYGYAADMPAIMALARERGVLVVEDAAQSLGARVGGRMSGAFGDFGVYSFHSHKNVTTLGEGGMLTLHDPRMAKLVPMLRHNGHCAFDFPRDDYWIPAMGNVDLPEWEGERLWPNNYCLGEIECALGAKLLERVEAINAEKRARAMAFIDGLSDFPELRFHRVDSDRHSYHLLAAEMTNGRRNDFIRRMSREKEIQCVVQYYPLNRYDFYRKAGFGEANCPQADRFFDNMVSFPFHHWLTEAQLETMMQATRDLLRGL
ncbi:MAG: DegT/DnrJ/EryC1/StrS family aminotransferase [Magnetococcales bacterium]|nr:DegT/DnrJ/EryC1/StrS family aminotransferase [Magnetococcales bacterium]